MHPLVKVAGFAAMAVLFVAVVGVATAEVIQETMQESFENESERKPKHDQDDFQYQDMTLRHRKPHPNSQDLQELMLNEIQDTELELQRLLKKRQDLLQKQAGLQVKVVDSLADPLVAQLVDSAVDPLVTQLVEPLVTPLVDSAVDPLVAALVTPLVDSAVDPLVAALVTPLVDSAVDPLVDSQTLSVVAETGLPKGQFIPSHQLTETHPSSLNQTDTLGLQVEQSNGLESNPPGPLSIESISQVHQSTALDDSNLDTKTTVHQSTALDDSNLDMKTTVHQLTALDDSNLDMKTTVHQSTALDDSNLDTKSDDQQIVKNKQYHPNENSQDAIDITMVPLIDPTPIIHSPDLQDSIYLVQPQLVSTEQEIGQAFDVKPILINHTDQTVAPLPLSPTSSQSSLEWEKVECE